MDKKFDYKNVKDDIKKKAESAWNTTTKAVSDGIKWGINNPEKVVAIIGLAVAVMKASQSLVVSHRTHMERTRIDHTYYDPSTGFHWDLVRKATNSDRAAILAMKSDGMDTYSILKQLKLIK